MITSSLLKGAFLSYLHPCFISSPHVALYLIPAGPECSRNFTSNSGVIKSPGFPEKYPNNLDCTFMIFAPKMSEIILEFESFELEPDQTPPAGVFCRYDRLEIWDGFPGGKQSAYLSCKIWDETDPNVRWIVAVSSCCKFFFILIIVNPSIAAGQKKSDAPIAWHEALNWANKVTFEISRFFSKAFTTRGHKEAFLTRYWVRKKPNPSQHSGVHISILCFKQKTTELTSFYLFKLTILCLKFSLPKVEKDSHLNQFELYSTDLWSQILI